MYMAKRDSAAPVNASEGNGGEDFVQPSALAAARSPQFPSDPSPRTESYVREVLASDAALRSSMPPVAPHISRAKSAVAASGKSGSMRVPLPAELGAAPPRRTPARNPGEISSSRAEMIAVLRASVEEATGGTGRAPQLSAATSVHPGLQDAMPFADETATVPLAVSRVNEPVARALGSDPGVWSGVSTVPRRRMPSPDPAASILIDGQVPALESEQLRPTHPGFVGTGPLRLPPYLPASGGGSPEEGASALAFDTTPVRRHRGLITVAALALAVGGVMAFGLREQLTGMSAAPSVAGSLGEAPLEGVEVLHEIPNAQKDEQSQAGGGEQNPALRNPPRVRVVTPEEEAASLAEASATTATEADALTAVRFEDLPSAAPVRRAETAAHTETGKGNADSAMPSARLSINSVPVSEVFINGRPAGKTPLKNVAVTPGASAIIFVHPKLGKRRTDVTLEAGQKFVLTKKF
jgi:hypothetical protein